MLDSAESSLFGAGEDWFNNACVNVGYDQWWIYTEGFSRAVDILVEHVISNRIDLDALVYPIVFSARHSVELRLKHIHLDCCSLLNLNYVLPGHYDISKLWQMVRPLLIEVFPDEDHSDFISIDEIAIALGTADRGSFTFRYPVDKSGGKSLDPEIRHINMREFNEQFVEAAKTLDSIHIAIGNYLEYRAEMESEHGDW